jgi:hypothetical protein
MRANSAGFAVTRNVVVALLKLCGFSCLMPLFFFGYRLLPVRSKRLFRVWVLPTPPRPLSAARPRSASASWSCASTGSQPVKNGLRSGRFESANLEPAALGAASGDGPTGGLQQF